MDYIVNFTKEGSAVIEAESLEEAYEKAKSIEDNEIDWKHHFVYSMDDVEKI